MLRRIIQKHNKKLRNFFLPRKLIFALTSFHLFSLIAFYSCRDFAFLTISLLFVHIFIFKLVVAQSAGKDKQEYVWIYTEIRWENEKNTIFMCFLFGINIWISKRKGDRKTYAKVLKLVLSLCQKSFCSLRKLQKRVWTWIIY